MARLRIPSGNVDDLKRLKEESCAGCGRKGSDIMIKIGTEWYCSDCSEGVRDA